MARKNVQKRYSSEPGTDIQGLNTLALDLSSRFINLSANKLEIGIKKGLQRVGTFLKIDRCIFYEFIQHKTVFHPSYLWWPEEDNDFMRELNEWAWSRWNFVYDSIEYMAEKWKRGETFKFTSLDELPDEAEKFKKLYEKYHIKSSLSIPISIESSVTGAILVTTTRSHRSWPDELVPPLRLIGEIFAGSLARKKAEKARQEAYERLQSDYTYLRDEIRSENNFNEIIGQSDALEKAILMIDEVAPTDSTVLILGETGTGKELVARAIHNRSRRKDRPLIKVNCATLPADLIESELFGHEKGSFTGAIKRHIGRFELADGATLFLDEIGELPLELQPKLLRAIQDGEIERLGGSQTIKTDTRIIAATNRDLSKALNEGRFRQDLLFRLNIFPIKIPPLRERLEDIPLLVHWFAKKFGARMGKKIRMISQMSLEALKTYSWPGNIRELENLIERAVITFKNDPLRVEVPGSLKPLTKNLKTLDAIEREHILEILNDSHWKVEGSCGAAQTLGLKPSTLRHRMKKLGIKRPSINF